MWQRYQGEPSQRLQIMPSETRGIKWRTWYAMVWYGILGFNVPLDTIEVISETAALSSDVHLPFSNGRPAT